MNLEPKHFADFYTAVNGYSPFPWQKRLVEQVVAHGGRWPAVLDLPTSAGKTSAIDAAVFLLALQVTKVKGEFTPIPVEKRTAAVRTFFVVDRRIVVDEAGKKAENLAKLLNAPPADAAEIILAVAERLKSFSGECPAKGQDRRKALHVSVLRGGMYRDASWAESPTQPTICLSTVDQVGSRLLFRGYGVSPYLRAVHAGLVGNDALILVDEAHLSRPFLETLKAIEFYRSDRWAESLVKTPFQTVVMSATAGESALPIGPMAEEHEKRPPKLELSPQDRANKILKARLGATKRTRLEEVRGGAEDQETNRQAFAVKLAEIARELSAPPGPVRARRGEAQPLTVPEAHVIGVVVNRVDTARRVFQKLRDEANEDFDVILLTGRIRPYDRDRLLNEWFTFMEAKKGRPSRDGRKLYVVATQTIECGANINLDALVTEAAPLDSLRQRFGRLDRLGIREISDAVIVVRKDQLREKDPVYGNQVKATWDWLAKNTSGTGRNKRIDFGIDAFDALLPVDPDERRDLVASLGAPCAHAPVMMPAHVDDLVQTTIPPVPELKPELFLHGPQSGPADVSIVWRADITEEQFAAAADPDHPQREEREKEIVDTVALVPPVSMESLSMPIWAVRKWLAKAEPDDVTDVEGEPNPEAQERRQREGRPFLRWRGPNRDKKSKRGRRADSADDQNTETSDGSRIDTKLKPGDTIVVPSTYGGCDAFGWNPSENKPVTDVADDCSWRAKRRPVLRAHRPSKVHEIALTAWDVPLDDQGKDLARALSAAVVPDEETKIVSPRAIRSTLREWTDVLPKWFSDAIKERKGKLRGRELPYPDGCGRVLILPIQHPQSESDDVAGDGLADDEASNFLGVDDPVTLQKHCQGVQNKVRDFANRLGLTSFRDVLTRSALLHDCGKADPRFQEWLFGNPMDAAASRELIAKSGGDSRNPTAMDRARRQAGWPKYARHEAMSVLLVRDNDEARKGLTDPELLIHLLGTHHGRGRPLWPVTVDDELPDGAEIPERIECRIDDFELHSSGTMRPEAALMPFHAGWIDRFWQMIAKYGYWGLAYLEMLIVLADHQQSESEQEKGE